MKNLLMKCRNCMVYTMKDTCPRCGSPTAIAHPARFSPDDRYARYRSPLAYQDRPDPLISTEVDVVKD